ncbi:hypothetical protein ACJMK2_006429 [Sinanodonta woodiana]|uniref:BRCT domain-containing protein n=2 Tax=Sinanodonta woodiana TaxID=1069815 RepID=A0ABD3VWL4_SINWO
MKMVCLFILPSKIQKRRLEDMKTAARKRNITVVDIFCSSVTHIVTEHENLDQVVKTMKLADTGALDKIQVLSVAWFTDSMKAGAPVPVEERHRIKREKADTDNGGNDSNRRNPFILPEYACQRATCLKHYNHKFTRALEILQKHAELRDNEHDSSRALAFRRASCVLKSLPFPLTSMSQLKKLTNIGDHCKRVIQEILEDGECSEVTKLQDDWFHKMVVFTSIFGIGSATAKKWIEKGWSTIKDAQEGHISSDWRVKWAFHSDLNTPVKLQEAQYIQQIVRKEAETILPGIILQITGGFRRGWEEGHDVDILMTHPEDGKEVGFLARLLHRLHNKGIILCGNLEKSTYSDDMLTLDSKLSAKGQLDHFEKWLGIIKIPQSCSETPARDDSGSLSNIGSCDHKGTNSVAHPTSNTASEQPLNYQPLNLHESFEDLESKAKKQKLGTENELSPMKLAKLDRNWIARRVDLIVSPYNQYFYALVGWTGNKQFNRDIRTYAQKELGMKLSSHGLYDLNKNCALPARSEKEVFENLKLQYLEPWERNC